MWAAEFEKLGSECTSDARDWVQLSPAEKDKHQEPACQYATQLPIIIAVIPALCARDRWENITRPQGACEKPPKKFLNSTDCNVLVCVKLCYYPE